LRHGEDYPSCIYDDIHPCTEEEEEEEEEEESTFAPTTPSIYILLIDKCYIRDCKITFY
jgi:hypothetical protein